MDILKSPFAIPGLVSLGAFVGAYVAETEIDNLIRNNRFLVPITVSIAAGSAFFILRR